MSPPLVPVLSQIDPVHTILTSMIYFNIVHPCLGLPSGFSSSGFPQISYLHSSFAPKDIEKKSIEDIVKFKHLITKQTNQNYYIHGEIKRKLNLGSAYYHLEKSHDQLHNLDPSNTANIKLRIVYNT
jgi:hypothetical protein